MSKKLLIGGGVVGGLVVIIIIAAVVIFSSLDSIIKAAVEKFGPEITQAEVTLEKVEISATSGEGRLVGLRVGNPEGYNTESAFRLGEISVKIDIGTVTKDTVVIKEMLIKAPEITYEIGGSGSNLDTLKRNVDEFIAKQSGAAGVKKSGGGGNAGGPSADGGGEKEGPKLIIENLRIQSGKVNVSATFLGGKSLSAGLPEIHLKDIGKEKKGATPGEVAQEILAAINDSVKKAVGPSLGNITGTVKESIGAAKQLLSKGAQGSGDAVDKGAAAVGGALKSLFGK